MGSSLGVLTLDLVAKTGSFTGPLDKAERASKKNAAAISRHQREVTAAIGNSVKSLVGWAAGFVAFGAVKSFVTNSYAAADAIGKVAATAGITTDTLQEMRHAASLNGVSFDQLDQGMQRFNKSIGELRAGTGTLYTYLQKTDRALMSQVQSARSTDEALDLVYKSLKNITDSSERSALAVAAFGRSGQRLAIMADTYEDLRNEARELGLVIDSDLIKGAEEANDKMDTMARIIKTQLTSAVIELAPLVLNTAQGITELTLAVSKFFRATEKSESSTRITELTAELEELDAQIDAATKGNWDKVTTMKGPLLLTRSLGAAISEAKNLREELGKLAGQSDDSSGDGESQQLPIEMYKKAFSELETITQKTYNVMKEQYEADRDEFISITGDKVTALAIFYKKMEELNKKMYGDEWGDFGKTLKETSEKNKKQYEDDLELKKKINSLIRAEDEKLLSETSKREAVLRQLTEEADIAELKNKYSGVEEEIKLHEYKYDKLKELYEENSEERAQIERLEKAELEAINKDYWESYVESLGENMEDINSVATSTLDNMTSQFGDLFATAIMDSENLGEAFKTMMEGMASATLSAVGKMIAQWIIYKVSKLATDRASQAAAIPQFVSNAEAMALQAGINAYASAAAIPYAGWTIAPGAMAAALAVTEPMAAAIGTLAVAGMAHDGIDSIPETGTWLLKKGERVTTAQTSKRLDDTLNTIQTNTGGASGGGYGLAKPKVDLHVHYDGPVFLNKSHVKSTTRLFMSEIDKELTRRGGVL
jgi:hypothetical protein